MGSQQLLLIAVGVIIIGLMVISGITLFRGYYESANRDQLISTAYDLCNLAQMHYKKPREQGGGGKTYTGWVIPRQFRNTAAGRFSATVRATRVDFTALGNQIGRNGRTNVRVTARADANGNRITITN